MPEGVINFDEWESLIDTVDKSDIPVRFINRIDILLKEPVNDHNMQFIDIASLREKGYADQILEDILQKKILDLSENIKSISFYLDINYVAETVQQHTNNLLTDI